MKRHRTDNPLITQTLTNSYLKCTRLGHSRGVQKSHREEREMGKGSGIILVIWHILHHLFLKGRCHCHLYYLGQETSDRAAWVHTDSKRQAIATSKPVSRASLPGTLPSAGVCFVREGSREGKALIWRVAVAWVPKQEGACIAEPIMAWFFQRCRQHNPA